MDVFLTLLISTIPWIIFFFILGYFTTKILEGIKEAAKEITEEIRNLTPEKHLVSQGEATPVDPLKTE